MSSIWSKPVYMIVTPCNTQSMHITQVPLEDSSVDGFNSFAEAVGDELIVSSAMIFISPLSNLSYATTSQIKALC